MQTSSWTFGRIPASRHLRFYPVTPEVLMGLLTQDHEQHFRITEGIPEDATLVGSDYDPRTRTFRLLVEHPSFAGISERDEPPTYPVTLTSFDLNSSRVP